MTFTGRKGTALLAALIVSLCVNLLLAGIMVGGRWHGGPGPWWRDIPEEARPIMTQAFEANKAEFDARRDAVRQARQKVADILKADPIDQAALDQALADLSQKSQAIRQGEFFSSAEVLLAVVNRDYVEIEVVDDELAASLNLQRGERRAIYLTND